MVESVTTADTADHRTKSEILSALCVLCGASLLDPSNSHNENRKALTRRSPRFRKDREEKRATSGGRLASFRTVFASLAVKGFWGRKRHCVPMTEPDRGPIQVLTSLGMTRLGTYPGLHFRSTRNLGNRLAMVYRVWFHPVGGRDAWRTYLVTGTVASGARALFTTSNNCAP